MVPCPGSGTELLQIEIAQAAAMSRQKGFGLIGLVWIAAAVMAVVGSLLLFQLHRSRNTTCDRLATIAMDAKKIDYVRTWAAARTGDAEFMEAVRRNRS